MFGSFTDTDYVTSNPEYMNKFFEKFPVADSVDRQIIMLYLDTHSMYDLEEFTEYFNMYSRRALLFYKYPHKSNVIISMFKFFNTEGFNGGVESTYLSKKECEVQLQRMYSLGFKRGFIDFDEFVDTLCFAMLKPVRGEDENETFIQTMIRRVNAFEIRR